MPVVQNINSLVVPDAYVQLIPPQPVIQGVQTNVLGVVGIGSWGPVDKPVVVGNMQQEIQNFGTPLPQKYDLGTAVYLAGLQGGNSFVCVRVTDDTDVSATVALLDVDSGIGSYLTGIYTGELGNTIVASIGPGSSYTPGAPTYRLTINIQGGVPETFDNIGGTGATFWANLVNAVNAGQSIARGPSQIVVASLPTLIEAVNVTAGGTYQTVPTVSTTGPGSGATFAAHMEAKAVASVAAGGSGYAADDSIILAGGTSTTPIELKVLTVDGGGAVLTVDIVDGGDYTVIPADPVAQASTDGVGTGATFNIDWSVLSVAVVAGGSGYTNSSTVSFSPTGATATLQIGSIAAPEQDSYTLSGGTNGNAGVNSATLVGSDVSPRKGMYALRSTNSFVVILPDADDPAQWPAQSAFALSESCYVIGTVAPGYQDNIPGAIALLQASAIDNYGFKLMTGDWVQFSDPFNNQVRYVSPQSLIAGILISLPPYNSSLNKALNGIIATQRTAEGNPYSTADLAQMITGRLDVITRPIPANSFSYGSRNGVNTSSNSLTSQDNYPLMANFIGRSLSNAMGIYVGRPQNPKTRSDALVAIQAFLMNLFNQGYIGDVNNPGNAAAAFQVILDDSNNPSNRVAAGYMQADTRVVLFSIVLFFVNNVNLIQGGTQTIIQQPAANSQQAKLSANRMWR